MNARRSLFVMVAIAILLLAISLSLASRLHNIVNVTNGLVSSYAALNRWTELVKEQPPAFDAIQQQATIILSTTPLTLGVNKHPSAFFTDFLLRGNVSEAVMSDARKLEDVLVEELFECHRLQNYYSNIVNVIQILLTALMLIIGMVSYFMGRRSQDYRLAPFPEANPNPVFGLNYKGVIIYTNQAVKAVNTQLLGAGSDPISLLPKDYIDRLMMLRKHTELNSVWVHHVKNRIFQYKVQLLPKFDRIHVYSEDITEQEEIRARNAFIAYHDPVCLLANRQRLEQIIDGLHDPGQPLTLVMTNLKGLTKVTSTQGLTVSDQFARDFSIRLRIAYQSVVNAVIKDPVVFRFDENLFGCIYYNKLDQKTHIELSKALQGSVEKPYKNDKREYFFSVQSGVACEPSSISARHLIQRANLALHSLAGKDEHYQVFDRKIEADLQSVYQIEQSLRYAIELDELTMVYQPQQSLVTGELIGFEALMRWHRKGDVISPAVFIPIAEKTGLIHSMGNWALRDVLKQSLQWAQLSKVKPCVFAVNVSAQEFARSSFIENVKVALADYPARPDFIQLEITESLLLEDEDIAIERMHELKALGFTLAIDDFGTGYSSFSYLSRFPIDKLKIDRSFIVNMSNGARDEAIVAAMIDVAHQLGMDVIAEGVETASERAKLVSLGCDQLQGYLYGRPMNVSEATLFATEQVEVL